MSIAVCDRCTYHYVDTDAEPEAYDNDGDCVCLCINCREVAVDEDGHYDPDA